MLKTNLFCVKANPKRLTTCTASSSSTSKICKNCKFAVYDNYAQDNLLCKKMDEQDIVSGVFRRFSARDIRKNEGFCGSDGKWFQRKNLFDTFIFFIFQAYANSVLVYLLFLLIFSIITTNAVGYDSTKESSSSRPCQEMIVQR